MSVKVVIFDFDGTLADTLEAIVGITNRLALEFGYNPITPDKLVQIRNLSSREVIEQAGISIFKLPFLVRKIKSGLRTDIRQLNPIRGIEEALTQLKSEGSRLGILTSNSEENVETFLTQHGMQHLFSFIYSGTSLFGKHKVIKKFLISNNLTPEEVIYVGDETRDIESSRRIQIKIIAVSWGFNSGAALAKHNPDFLIHQPSELVEVLGNLQQIVSR